MEAIREEFLYLIILCEFEILKIEIITKSSQKIFLRWVDRCSEFCASWGTLRSEPWPWLRHSCFQSGSGQSEICWTSASGSLQASLLLRFPLRRHPQLLTSQQSSFSKYYKTSVRDMMIEKWICEGLNTQAGYSYLILTIWIYYLN